MNLSTLLFRPLLIPEENKHSGECAATLGAIFARAYSDRATARRLGWQGIRQDDSAPLPAWICRVANCDYTIGIRFESEAVLPNRQGIRGVFKLFVFPSPYSSLLDSFSLRALATGGREDYKTLAQHFTRPEHLTAAEDFFSGRLYMVLALDGSGKKTRDQPGRRIQRHGHPHRGAQRL